MEPFIMGNDMHTELEIELLLIVKRYLKDVPAFRSKPMGAPGSEAREKQERHQDIEYDARSILNREGYRKRAAP